MDYKADKQINSIKNAKKTKEKLQKIENSELEND